MQGSPKKRKQEARKKCGTVSLACPTQHRPGVGTGLVFLLVSLWGAGGRFPKARHGRVYCAIQHHLPYTIPNMGHGGISLVLLFSYFMPDGPRGTAGMGNLIDPGGAG